MITALLDRPVEHEAVRAAARRIGVWRSVSRARLAVRTAGGVWHQGLGSCGRRRGARTVEVRALSSLSGTWCRCLVVEAADLWSPWRSGTAASLVTVLYAARVEDLLDQLAASRRVALLRSLSDLTAGDVVAELSSHGLSAAQLDLLREVTSSLRLRAEDVLSDPASRARRRRLALASLVREFSLGPLALDDQELLVGAALDVNRLRRLRPSLGEVVESCTLRSSGRTALLSMPRFAYDVLQRNSGTGSDFRSLQATSMRPCDLEAVLTLWDPAGEGALCDLSRAVETALLA